MSRAVNRLKAVNVAKIRTVGRHSDGGGLLLAVTKTKSDFARSWLFQYTSPTTGKVRQKGLGPLTTVKLGEARDIAEDLRKLVKKKIDPIEKELAEARAARIASEGKVTFEKRAREYIAAHRSTWRNPIHANQWVTSLERFVFPKIGHFDIAEVTRLDVLNILKPDWERITETMSRVQGRMSIIFDAAVADELRADNPGAWTVLKHKLSSPRKKKRMHGKHHAAMPVDAVPAFMAELRANESISAKALEFTVLTAARTGETIGALWSEINFATATWTIPGVRMKAGREHRVPLSSRALEIVKSLPRIRGNNHIFPGTSANGGLSRMGMYMLLVGQRDNVTVHGFRSSYRDWAEERTSFPASVIELSLAHISGDKVQAAYLRSQLWEKRKKLAADWSRYCASPVAAKGGNVVPMQSRKHAT